MRRNLMTKRRGAIEMEYAGGFRIADLLRTDLKSGSILREGQRRVSSGRERLLFGLSSPRAAPSLSAIVHMRGAIGEPLHNLS